MMSQLLSRPSLRAAGWISAALLLGTVAGCSSAATGSASSTTATLSSSGSAVFPVTVQHEFGTTTVPAVPERVVTIGFNEQDFALALGVTPVGVREFFGYDYKNRPWAQEQLAGKVPAEVGGQELNIFFPAAN